MQSDDLFKELGGGSKSNNCAKQESKSMIIRGLSSCCLQTDHYETEENNCSRTQEDQAKPKDLRRFSSNQMIQPKKGSSILDNPHSFDSLYFYD